MGESDRVVSCLTREERSGKVRRRFLLTDPDSGCSICLRTVSRSPCKWRRVRHWPNYLPKPTVSLTRGRKSSSRLFRRRNLCIWGFRGLPVCVHGWCISISFIQLFRLTLDYDYFIQISIVFYKLQNLIKFMTTVLLLYTTHFTGTSPLICSSDTYFLTDWLK